MFPFSNFIRIVKTKTIQNDTITVEQICPAGKFCTAGVSTAQDCPAGSFCPAGSTFALECPVEAYCPITGLTNFYPCAQTSICPSGSIIELTTNGNIILNGEATTIYLLSPLQITALTLSQLGSLTISQLGSLTIPQINAFTPSQFGALPITKGYLTSNTAPTTNSAGKVSVTTSYYGSIIYTNGTDGYIYKSVDYGSTWTITPLISSVGIAIGNSSGTFTSIKCSSDGNIAFVCEKEGNIYRYNSSTNVVTTLSVTTTTGLWNVVTCSSDGTNIIAVTENDGIYYSTTSGDNWNRSNAPQKDWEYVASSSDGSIAYAVEITTNLIWKSTNYGAIWEPISSGSLPAYKWTSICCDSSGSIVTATYYNGSTGVFINLSMGVVIG